MYRAGRPYTVSAVCLGAIWPVWCINHNLISLDCPWLWPHVRLRKCTQALICHCLKSYNVQKREIRFTLGINATKNTHYNKKASNKSCWELNFVQKVHECKCLSPPQVELGGYRDQCVWNLILTVHSLGALISGIVNEVSCTLLYHYTHRENTPVSCELKF